MLHTLRCALPAIRRASVWLILLGVVAGLSACAARQIDTQAFVTVPVEVPRLLVVYQPAPAAGEQMAVPPGAAPAADAPVPAAPESADVVPGAAGEPPARPLTPASTLAVRQTQRERLSDALGDSLEAHLPAGLTAAGIPALFVRATNVTTVLNSKTARASVSHVLYLRIQNDQEECSGGECSYRVTLRATLLRSGAAPTLWRTDLQEAYFRSSHLDAARFDDLSSQLAKAVAPMLRVP